MLYVVINQFPTLYSFWLFSHDNCCGLLFFVNLILFTFLLSFAFYGVDADLFVILLESRQILAGLGELSLLHTLSHVPVHEGALGVHQVELVVKASPGLGDGGGVAQHAHGTLDLGQVTSRDNGWWLVVDADLETSWAPIDELDGTLGLDGCNGGVDIFGDDIATVQHTAGHVFAVTRITLDHLIGWLKAGVGDFSNRQLLVVGLLGRDDGSVCRQREVDTWVGHQVGLELGQVDVKGTVKPQRSSNGADYLANQTVQVGVGRTLYVQVTTADIVDSLVVDHEGTVGVLESGVGGQDRVVWLHHCGGHLRSRVDRKFQL